MSIASSSHEQQISQSSSPRNENHFENNLVGKPDLDMNGRFLEGMVTHPHTRRGGSSGSIIGPDTVLSTSKGDSDKMQNYFRSTSSSSGGHIPPTIDDMYCSTISKDSKTLVKSDEQDDKVKPVVQQRGRFKVTSENVDIEKVAPSPLLQKKNQHAGTSPTHWHSFTITI